MTLIEMLRANGSWEADAAVTAIQVRDSRLEKLKAALRDFLLWGDHCQHCDYDDDWAKIEVRARKALEENK